MKIVLKPQNFNQALYFAMGVPNYSIVDALKFKSFELETERVTQIRKVKNGVNEAHIVDFTRNGFLCSLVIDPLPEELYRLKPTVQTISARTYTFEGTKRYLKKLPLASATISSVLLGYLWSLLVAPIYGFFSSLVVEKQWLENGSCQAECVSELLQLVWVGASIILFPILSISIAIFCWRFAARLKDYRLFFAIRAESLILTTIVISLMIFSSGHFMKTLPKMRSLAQKYVTGELTLSSQQK